MAASDADPRLVRSALRRLRRTPVRLGRVDPEAAEQPGLYAFYASATTWRELGLGAPPDGRPLYVGKAESTLASRDLDVHFGMRARGAQSPTGSSTLRRSLAALLTGARGYRGVPRNPNKPSHFANYGLTVAQDDDLSLWMRRRLRITLWPHEDPSALDDVETAVLGKLGPPLNLSKVETPWRQNVKKTREVLARQAERAAARGTRRRAS